MTTHKPSAPAHVVSSPAFAGSFGPLDFGPLDFDTLDFFDSTLSEPTVVDQTMTVLASGLNHVVPGSAGVPLPPVRLVFSGLARSHREIHPYIGSPTEGRFADTIYVNDIVPGSASGPALNSYHIEGVLQRPLSWVTWTIEATSVLIEAAA